MTRARPTPTPHTQPPPSGPHGKGDSGSNPNRTLRTLTPGWRLRQWPESYLFASPWIVGFLTFTVGAMIFSIWMSAQRWNLTSPPQFVGLRNYEKAFLRDPLFWKCLTNTAYYSFVSVPLRIVFAMLLAVLLNQPLRGIPIFRTIFYLPSVVTGVATAMLWVMLLNPDPGGINYVLRRVGVAHPPGWLTDERWAMPGLIVMSLWGVGSMMLIFLAGLQNVPEELLDAAQIDGAGPW